MLRLAYLALTNTFALIRLLPMSDRDKDVEILALRHQLAVLQRMRGKPAVTDPKRIAYLDVRRRDRPGGILHEYRHAA
jgi:putative transposase